MAPFERTLHCHPASSSAAVDHFSVVVSSGSSGGITLGYRIFGQIDRLLIPAQTISAQTNRLWEHTCCEAFFGHDGETAYREFNFSPSGHWAVLDFSAYRENPRKADLSEAPQISVRRFPDRLELDAVLPSSAILGENMGLPRTGLSAVIEELTEETPGLPPKFSLSYWALHHPSKRPDFHHRDTFILETI